uniref:7TM_GPCR_Srx domain-containing protein n=1 Tax=Steinernema glaseri TaxID=37863 RepID=A0A1I7Y2B7_9BILA
MPQHTITRSTYVHGPIHGCRTAANDRHFASDIPMNGTALAYGNELQGRGFATTADLAFGYFTTSIGIAAFLGAMLNFYLIANVKSFHNAFGFFWGARTVGEIGSDIVYGFFTGPITILQPTNIPPTLSIVAYHFAFTLTYIQCIMHWAVSINRLVAVCFPIHYRMIFNKKLCISVVVAICVKALLVVSLFIVFPCNHIGYSPRFHENVFVRCAAELDRDYSLISHVLYKICFSVACAGTGVINLITFSKIAHIRMTSQHAYNGQEFKRDVRLFTLGAIQDVCMTVVVAAIIICNNDERAPTIGILLSYDGLMISMALFNSKCRRFLLNREGKVGTSALDPSHSALGTSKVPKAATGA